ncbi:4440_t:CDS:2, partial [Gigaspora rosea]
MADVERLVSLVGIMVRLVAATVKELRLKHCWSGRSINVVGHDCATHVESLDIMHVSVCKYLKIERILNVEKIVRRSKNEEWKSTNLDDEDVNIRFLRIMGEDNDDTKRNVNVNRNVKEKGKIEDKPERSGGRRISKRYRKSAKIETIGNRAMMNSSGGIKKGFEWNLKCTEVGDCSAENTNEMYNIGCYYERRTKISIWTLKSREQ